MTSLLTLAIGLGLAVSLFMTEIFGLAAGGLVVPGYVALFLNRPIDIALTLGTGIATFFIVHTVSTIAIVYGRRRTTLMILFGFLLGLSVEHLPVAWLESLTSLDRQHAGDVQVIGYIIPGLIGLWIDRQGLVETLSVLMTSAVIVRLLLILLGMELPA